MTTGRPTGVERIRLNVAVRRVRRVLALRRMLEREEERLDEVLASLRTRDGTTGGQGVAADRASARAGGVPVQPDSRGGSTPPPSTRHEP